MRRRAGCPCSARRRDAPRPRDAPPTLLAGGLKARVTAARIRPDGVTVYDIAVSAAEAWTVTALPEVRAAAGVSSGPRRCDGRRFPRAVGGGTARKQALEGWPAPRLGRRRSARAEVVPVLGAMPARADAAAADPPRARSCGTIPFAAPAPRRAPQSPSCAALKRQSRASGATGSATRARRCSRAAALPPERVAAPRAVLPS